MGGERTYFARMVNGGPVAVDTVMLLGARVTAVEGYQSRPLVLVYAVLHFSDFRRIRELCERR